MGKAEQEDEGQDSREDSDVKPLDPSRDVDGRLHGGETVAVSLSIAQDRFKTGWRPAAGWVCVLAMAVNYVLLPLVNVAVQVVGQPAIPLVDLTVMMPVLFSLLGLGAYRTYEKKQGVASGYHSG